MGYRKAIEQQQQLVAASPNDVRLLQKLGELFERAGQLGSAAEAFAQVATKHAIDGPSVKAVGMMKHALRLNPKLVAHREALAGWYAGLSLMTEAAGEYRVVLEQFRMAQAVGDVERVVGALAGLGASIDPGSPRS